MTDLRERRGAPGIEHMAALPFPSIAPTALQSTGKLRFFGPLQDLVAIGLFRPALDALVADSDAIPEPPVDRAYLLKILDEEIARPFGHPLRPIVELVLNAADALASSGPGGVIDVSAENGRVEVDDGGEGMDLFAILARLLLPFATDRVPGVHQGRFGVGFFSVLGFGAAHPESFALVVETGDGKRGHRLEVRAAGRDASTFTAAIHENAPRRGTRVSVRSALLDGSAVRTYLEDALHFFPPERAVVRAGGTPLNDGALVSGGQLFEEEAGPGLWARFHLGGRGLAAGITAALYHAGVKVRPCYAVAELALVDFPSAVELTEGRDALKPGPAFAAVAAAFHRRLARLGEEPDTPEDVRLRIAELAAQISALMLDSAAFREVAPELARALLGGGRHLVPANRVEGVLGFLGPGAASRLFVPESFWAAREWQGLVSGERELLLDELWIEPPERLVVVARRRPDLAGLAMLAARAADGVMVALAHGRKRPPGPLPCLGTREAVLVRADSPAVIEPRGWADRYALRAAFDRALGVREADVERDLIVTTPIMRPANDGGGEP
ncbi:MAG: ATP-binding protein [Minicystis sp.]